MLLKLESAFFSNRNRRLNFKCLKKNRAVRSLDRVRLPCVSWCQLSDKRLMFGITNKKVTEAKLLNIVLASEKSTRTV